MVSAKISGVVPVRLVPCSKVMETMIGRSLSARMAAHGNAHFRQIELRFDEEQIHAAFHKAARLFAQGFIQLQRVQVPKRTHELPARPHVAGDEGFPAGGVHGGAGDPGHRAVERRDVDARRKLETRAAEGARQNDVRARGEVVGVDPPEHVRPIEAELFRCSPAGRPLACNMVPMPPSSSRVRPEASALRKSATRFSFMVSCPFTGGQVLNGS